MSETNNYISAALRRLVAERAGYRCEYCLLAEHDMGYAPQIDHIVGLKHGGPTHIDNLAFSCWLCNSNKGSDIGSLTKGARTLTRFFNPRTDIWAEHFQLNVGYIEPLTDIGDVTESIFQFNKKTRVDERAILFKS
jgi:hypothetical protein